MKHQRVTVAFTGVGPGRVDWTAELWEFSGEEILKELHRSHAFTRLPDIDYDLRAGTGNIWMGGTIPMGRFEVVK